MPSIIRTYCLLFIIVWTIPIAAQPIHEQGYMSGSGVSFMPTTTIFPPANFRVQLGRFSAFTKHRTGITTFDMTCGLSSHLEMYMKLLLEQTPVSLAYSMFGVGGKFLLPVDVPLFARIALWSESISSSGGDSTSMLPAHVVRAGLVFGTAFHGNSRQDNNFVSAIQPSLLIGVTRINGVNRLLAGAAIRKGISSSVSIGVEAISGYDGNSDVQTSIAISGRILPILSVQISPGYLFSRDQSGLLLSGGISVSTAVVDFLPSITEDRKPTIPSFDDIERQLREEKQPDEKQQE